MRLLVLAEHVPAPDRASGELRFARVLELLAPAHEVVLCETKPGDLARAYGEGEHARYRRLAEAAGVTLHAGQPEAALRSGVYDVVLFEFHHQARAWLAKAREAQPAAAMVVDSVDVHFRRLFAQALLARSPVKLWHAVRRRRRELEAYRASDLVLACSVEDRDLLGRAAPGVPVEVVPNVHPIPSLVAAIPKRPASLVFVGWFGHGPNVDAIRWLCGKVLPLVRREVPEVELDVIGSDAPASVRALAGPGVRLLGFVPETAPHILASEVSVAPLRYGAGMKGKVGEALALAMPVATTTAGADGFGIVHGVHALVADRPGPFAENVIRLLRDPALRARLGSAGRARVEAVCGPAAVAAALTAALARVAAPAYEPRAPGATAGALRPARG